MKSHFPHLKTIRVMVKERRTDELARPGHWRTHEYTGLETVPLQLRPAFASPGTQAELDLVALVRQAYASGRCEVSHEAPYHDGTGCDKRPVERAITIRLTYLPAHPTAVNSRAASGGHVMETGQATRADRSVA